METHQASKEDLEKLGELINDIRVAMLTTTEQPGGRLRSRPMYVQEAEFDGDLWFFSRKDSPKMEQVRREHEVNVAFAEPGDSRYVSISGTASVVTDRTKMEALWSEPLRAWFPDGLDDPELALLKIHAEQAEYWETASGTMKVLFGYAKAALTGERDKNEIGENEKLDL